MWTGEDRGYALGWQTIEDGKCPCGCGFQLYETTGKENEDRFDGHPIRCWAGKAREDAIESATDKSGLLAYATEDPHHQSARDGGQP